MARNREESQVSQDMVLGQPTSACVSKRCIVQAERRGREATNVDCIYVSRLVEGHVSLPNPRKEPC